MRVTIVWIPISGLTGTTGASLLAAAMIPISANVFIAYAYRIRFGQGSGGRPGGCNRGTRCPGSGPLPSRLIRCICVEVHQRAVLDPVPGIMSRELRLGRLVGVEDRVDCGVSDGVDADLEPGIVRANHPLGDLSRARSSRARSCPARRQ